jgi:hypothetical protein
VLGRATNNTDTLDSPRFGIEGSHHLPLYRILCGWPRSLHSNGFFLLGLPSRAPEIASVGTFATLEPHNFANKLQIKMQSAAKL